MSRTYHLVCHEKKLHVWVGQGTNEHGQMASFYSGEPETMLRLADFLRRTQGHDIRLVDSETLDEHEGDYTDLSDYNAN